MKYYYSPGACSLAAHILLEELKAPYEGIAIDLSRGQNRQPEYLAINPAGSVPALALDDGNVITQNIAILMYLAEQHPQANLIPAAGTLERARCYECLAFLTSDVHKAYGPLFSPTKFASSDAAKQEVTNAARKRVSDVFDLLEKRMHGRMYTMGDQFSVCDPYFFVMTRWLGYHQFDTAKWPQVMDIANRIAARPAVQAMLVAEGLVKK